jgi:hypothetical protein
MSKNMAEIDENGFVVNILVCANNEQETATRVNYSQDNPAYIGGTFDGGFFYPPQSYKSWLKDKGSWVAPVPYPTDGAKYTWDEETTSWIEVTE